MLISTSELIEELSKDADLEKVVKRMGVGGEESLDVVGVHEVTFACDVCSERSRGVTGMELKRCFTMALSPFTYPFVVNSNSTRADTDYREMEMDMSTESPNATTETVASTEPTSQIAQPSENQKKDAVMQSGYCLHSITDRG